MVVVVSSPSAAPLHCKAARSEALWASVGSEAGGRAGASGPRQQRAAAASSFAQRTISPCIASHIACSCADIYGRHDPFIKVRCAGWAAASAAAGLAGWGDQLQAAGMHVRQMLTEGQHKLKGAKWNGAMALCAGVRAHH